MSRHSYMFKPRQYVVSAHLSIIEIEQLLTAAHQSHHGERNVAIILLMFRHALWTGDLLKLCWSDIDWARGLIVPLGHPLATDERRALTSLALQYRGGETIFPLKPRAIRYMIARAAKRAGIRADPRMLRHSCGYALARKGTDIQTLQRYLGHRNINSTLRYYPARDGRIKPLWRC